MLSIPILMFWCWHRLWIRLPIHFSVYSSPLAVVLIGFVSRYVLSRFAWVRFMETILHEMNHAFWGFLTLHDANELNVRAGKGASISLKGTGNLFVHLAPYWFPVLAYLFFLFAWFFGMPFTEKWVTTGFLAGYALGQSLFECGPRQTDLQRYGYVLACGMVLALAVLSYGLLFLMYLNKI